MKSFAIKKKHPKGSEYLKDWSFLLLLYLEPQLLKVFSIKLFFSFEDDIELSFSNNFLHLSSSSLIIKKSMLGIDKDLSLFVRRNLFQNLHDFVDAVGLCKKKFHQLSTELEI